MLLESGAWGGLHKSGVSMVLTQGVRAAYNRVAPENLYAVRTNGEKLTNYTYAYLGAMGQCPWSLL